MQTIQLANAARRRRPRYRGGLLALTLALLVLLGTAFYQTPRAHAGSTGPIIHWDGGMIYPGQNNGYPEGPVGEPAVVHGEGFTAGQQLKLFLVQGDILSDSTLCQATKSVAMVGNATASSDGSFTANFDWPAGAGQVNKTYSICSLLVSDNSIASTRDDGPFTVLSASKPSFVISTTSVAAGGTLNIQGKNWVPPQPLNIIIAGCADCDTGNSLVTTATTSSSGLNAGTFSVSVPIPATSTPGNYVVNVSSQSGPLDAYRLQGVGIQNLAVTAAVATPTAAPSPSPTTTATAGTTPTTTASTTGTTSNNNGSTGGNNGFLLLILIAMVVLLLAIAGLVFYMLSQRNKQSTPPNGPPSHPGSYPGVGQSNGPPSYPGSYPGGGQFNQYGASGGPITPFPAGPGQQINQQGQFGSSPNNGYAGYNNQSWQGNQQQGNFAPSRACVRCGGPLAPNSAICGRCGTYNTTEVDPNGPTIAY